MGLHIEGENAQAEQCIVDEEGDYYTKCCCRTRDALDFTNGVGRFSATSMMTVIRHFYCFFFSPLYGIHPKPTCGVILSARAKFVRQMCSHKMRFQRGAGFCHEIAGDSLPAARSLLASAITPTRNPHPIALTQRPTSTWLVCHAMVVLGTVLDASFACTGRSTRNPMAIQSKPLLVHNYCCATSPEINISTTSDQFP